MIYAYECSSCKKQFDVIKPVSQIDDKEYCECKAEAKRIFVPPKLYFNNLKVQDPYFSTALGEMVKDDHDLRRKAKERGLTEIGNELGALKEGMKPKTKEYD